MRSNFWKRSFIMDYLKQFSIPYRGMLDGVHEYNFELDDEFFRHFEASPIQKAKIEARLLADKQASLVTVNLTIEGVMQANCDRCLADIQLPLNGRYQLILKRAEGNPDDPDLFYIGSEESEWKVAEVLYEYACLSIPFSKTIDCSNLIPRPCNMEVLVKIQNEENDSEPNPIWDELRKLK